VDVAKGIGMMVLGFILVYVGAAGGSIVPQFTLAPSSGEWSDPFTSSIDPTRWAIWKDGQGTVQIVSGRLEITAPIVSGVTGGGAVYTTYQYDLRSSTTIEVDCGELSGGGNTECIALTLTNPTNGYFYRITLTPSRDKLEVLKYTGSWTDAVKTSAPQSGVLGTRFRIAVSGPTIAFFHMPSGASAYSPLWQDSADPQILQSAEVSLLVGSKLPDAQGGGWFDNFYFKWGTGPSQTGTLVVNAVHEGTAVSVMVTITGPTETRTQTTPYTWTNAPTGLYSASGTYEGEVKTGSVTVTADQTATITLTWGGSQFPDITQMIRDFLDNQLVRWSFTGSGLACIIGPPLSWLSGRRRRPAYSFPY